MITCPDCMDETEQYCPDCTYCMDCAAPICDDCGSCLDCCLCEEGDPIDRILGV